METDDTQKRFLALLEESAKREQELKQALLEARWSQESTAAKAANLEVKLKESQRENQVLHASLLEQVDDWENAVAHARDNRSDEQHCTCVPPLLWKMKQLERKYAALEKLIIKVGYIITTFNGEMALCRDPWHQAKEEQP